MDENLANKTHAATEITETEIDSVASSSSFTLPSRKLTTSINTPTGETVVNKNKKANKFVTERSNAVKEEFLVRPDDKHSYPKAQHPQQDSSSSISSSLNSFNAFLMAKREIATSTEKMLSDYSTSTSSTVTTTGTDRIEKRTVATDGLSENNLELDTNQLRAQSSVSVEDSLSSVPSILIGKVQFASHSSEIKIKSIEQESNETAVPVRFSLDERESSKSKKVSETASLADSGGAQSHHVKSVLNDLNLNNENSVDTTNLQIGHVFVYMIIPPDGGYGWLISFISFLCQIVVDGIIFSIGILLPFIANDLNIPGSQVVLVASMQIGFYFLSGTLSSAFINKYGFRRVALSGCLLAITVLTISTFSINLPMILLFYSILGGPALSMIWVSSQLIIGYYFDKFRSIANGASCSGAGVGIMLFSFMNNVLVPVLGWRNLMRLHVGFLIIVLVMTLTFIEVTPTRIGRVKELLAEDTESESLDIFTGLTEYSRYSLKVTDKEYFLDDNFDSILEKIDGVAYKQPSTCWEKCCPFLSKSRESVTEQNVREEEDYKRYIIKQDLIEKQDMFYAGPRDYETKQENGASTLKRLNTTTASDESTPWRTISLEEIENKYKRQTIINTLSSMKVVRDQQQERKHRQTYNELKLINKSPLMAFLSPKNWLHPKILKAFDVLFDFRLLSVVEFRILLLSAFLFPMGFNIPFVYSTVRVQIDASFARLITPAIGFSNFIFRIASGFIAFKYREYTTCICGGGIFFGGLAVLVSACYGLDVVWFQFLYAICYGIAPAFYSSLRAIIYVRVLGLDKLTNAFGLTALAMGLGVFIGTTAGGMLNDHTGSYTASFIFAGICICLSGALKLSLPYFITSKLSKDKK